MTNLKPRAERDGGEDRIHVEDSAHDPSTTSGRSPFDKGQYGTPEHWFILRDGEVIGRLGEAQPLGEDGRNVKAWIQRKRKRRR